MANTRGEYGNFAVHPSNSDETLSGGFVMGRLMHLPESPLDGDTEPRMEQRTTLALLLLLVFSILSGCGGGYPGSPLTSLSTVMSTIDAGQSLQVTATAGVSLPLTWSLSTADCPAEICGTLSSMSSTSATYTAPSFLAAPIHVTVTATVSGTSSVQTTVITVNPDPTISGTSLSGTVGVAYSATLAGIGGTGAVTLKLASGSLPSGLAFNPTTGVISGTPTAMGTFNFVVSGTDQCVIPFTVSRTFSITVVAAGSSLMVVGGNPPSGTVGVAYTTALVASGGSLPYTWSVVSGALPGGLSLNPATGIILGVPTTAGSFTFVAQVKDATGATATGAFTITISQTTPTLTITVGSLPNGTVSIPYVATIGVSGGAAPYTCTITSGALPAGLALGPNCVVTGIPTVAGTVSLGVKAVDSSNPTQTTTGTITLNIVPSPLSITTGSLPGGTVGVAYSSTIGVAGGTSPYGCTITSGILPSGLSLGANCLVSGTPTTAGTVTLAVKATDASSPVLTTAGSVVLTINPAPLTLTMGTLPVGTVGVAYSSPIGVAGGTSPYSCTITAGTLPAGLALGANCLVSGTPTTAGTATLTVKATDGGSPALTATGQVTLLINPAALTITIGSLPSGTVGVTYSSPIVVGGGTSPYSCSITGGTLPAGLTLAANCVVSGTPSTTGTATLTVKATDSASPALTATGQVTLVINPAPLAITTGSLPNGTVGVTYSSTIGVTGGTSPYSCTITSGTLPAGLTLGASCLVSGTPSTAGTVTLTVKATDSSSPVLTATGQVTLVINPAPVTIMTGGLPNGTVGVIYSSTIGVSGGTAPYSCTITSGTLPKGLSLGPNCLVSGLPTATGTATLTVKATDSSSPALSGTGQVLLTITAAPVTFAFSNPAAATVSTPYSGTIGVTGGTAPYTCSLASGTLPAGLTLGTNCSLSGTPAAVGVTAVGISATDSVQNTGTGNVTITVNALGALTLTGTTPNAIVNVAYSAPLTTAGGLAPYHYAVTAGTLNPGLAVDGNTGTISGTPTIVGASKFTVTVTDSETTPKTASLPLTLLVTYAPTTNDTLLKGPYAFLFQGYDDVLVGTLAYQNATVGSFTADGNGVLTTGEMDSNHQSSTPVGVTVSSTGLLGTYTIGSDDRGTMAVTALNADGTVGATVTYAIAVKAAVSPTTTAASGSMDEIDGTVLIGSRGSGTFLQQNATAMAAGLSGSYAFGVSGDTPCLPACTVGIVAGPAATVGQFTVVSGSVSSGTSDANIASTNYASSALSGTTGAADGNGRVQVSLTTSNMPAGVYPSDFAFYVVDATHAFLMSTDKHSAYILLAGSATAQTSTTFSNASLSGNYIGYENSPTNPGLVGATLQNVLNLTTATIFSGTANATGTCTTTHVDQAGTTALVNGLTGLGSGANILNALLGTYSSTGDSACTVVSNGRTVLSYPVPSTVLSGVLTLLGLPTSAPPARVVYLSSPNAGYFLETGYAGLGHLEKQTGSPFTLATLDGTYIYGTTPGVSVASVDGSGTFTADGKGNASSTEDLNVGVGHLNVVQLGVGGSTTYTLNDASAGRFLLAPTSVIYAISPSRLVQVDESIANTSPTVALLY